MSQTHAIACSQSPSVHCMHVPDNVGLFIHIDSTAVLRTLNSIKFHVKVFVLFSIWKNIN